MSNQELPVIKNLRQNLEKEAVETAKKNRPSLTQSTSENKKEEQKSTEVRQENKEQPRIFVDENKLFTKKPSIFGAKSENKTIESIFASRKSVNLFNVTNKPSNQNPRLNIFTLASSSQPLIKNELEDDLLSQSSQGPQDNPIEQVLKQPEYKVMKYKYQDKMVRLGEFRVAKFKNGGAASKEGKMLVSLEKQKEGDSKITYLILRSEATKITLYQGILLTNVKIQHFLNKEQNIKLFVIHLHKKEHNTVTEGEVLKIQFENVEEAKRFEDIILQKEEKKEEKKQEKKEE